MGIQPVSDFGSWLNTEIEHEQGRRPIGPARYQRSDFREVRTAAGKRGRFENQRTGENVPRSQMQRLIGRPIGKMNRAKATEKIAERLADQGVTVQAFAAQTFDRGYGRVKGHRGQVPRHRTRRMREPVRVDPEDLEDVAAALDAGNVAEAAELFNHAVVRSWWDGGDTEIEGVDELEMSL